MCAAVLGAAKNAREKIVLFGTNGRGQCRMRAMEVRDKPTALASPWQNGGAERLIGSIQASAWTISSSWARHICAGSSESMLAITTTSERIGLWTKMRRFLAPFSGLES